MRSTKNKVLIVDDTPENLRVLGEILSKEGHEVRVANNGTQGLEIARTAGIDLILLDVMMPDLNGYEVCAKLKKDPKTRDLPVIFLTALDSVEDEAKGLTLGAVDYIAKPFKVELVRTRIANQLELHNARVELKKHNLQLDELVAERARELAEAHRQLKTLDSAKYDFLQLIYHKLWGSETSFVPLASKSWSLTDPGLPDRAESLERYESSQRDLFDTVRNALLMTSGKPQEARVTTLAALLPGIRDRGRIKAGSRGVDFVKPATVPGGEVSLAGEKDLLLQALGTFAQVAALLADAKTSVQEEWEVKNGGAVISWTGQGAWDQEWASLFQTEGGIHPSSVGQSLGIDLPLAVKITLALGGAATLASSPAGWVLRVSLSSPQFR